jgi:hypothetical protein
MLALDTYRPESFKKKTGCSAAQGRLPKKNAVFATPLSDLAGRSSAI